MKLISKSKKQITQPLSPPVSTEERFRQLEKVANRIEKMRLGDYVENMNKPGRIIWINLLGGISKGVGLTIGATLVIALLFKLMGVLISMNIPYLTEMLQEVVQVVKTTPGVEKFAPAEGFPVIPEQITPAEIKLNTER